jgi:hypothetical protein
MIYEVVVFDPLRLIPEGKVFPSDAALAQAKRRGVVTLVCDPTKEHLLPARHARFTYGDGVPVGLRPEYSARAHLFLRRSKRGVTWAAQLVAEPGPKAGLLRLLGDTSQAPLPSAPCGNGAENQGAPHWVDDRLMVSGFVPLSVVMDGFYAFALHGAMDPARVVWLALAQTE